MTPSHDHRLPAAEEDAAEALWMQQERLRKAVAAGAEAPAAERALYAALAEMTLPPPPAGFVADTAGLLQRASDARRRIARLRAAWLRLFGVLYLPVMLLAAWLFAADLPAAWSRADPAQRTLLEWTVAIALLATGSALASRLRSRRDG